MEVNKKNVEKFIEEVRSGKKDPEAEMKNLPLADLGNLIEILKTFANEQVGEILKIAQKHQTKKKEESQKRKEEKEARHRLTQKQKFEKKPSFANRR